MITNKKLKGFLTSAFLGAALTSTVLPAYTAEANDNAAPQPTEAQLREMIKSDRSVQIQYIGFVLEVARQMHVDQDKAEDSERIIAGAINGALEELDPHSSYMTPEEFAEMKQQSSGQFSGIGAVIATDKKVLTIEETMKNSPAERAGLKGGDEITHIDGKSTTGSTPKESISMITGKQGTPVKLTINRNGQAPFDISIVRDFVRVEAVRGKMIGNDIGYVQIATFSNDHVDEELKSAIEDLKKNNDVKGYVIDLRYNPGGYLHMANALSDAFIDSNAPIMSVKGRDASDSRVYHATPGDIADGKPIVVLVNEGTASASEIMAGALQDLGRATILGTQSYGKGTVQQVIPLKTGAALKITIQRYFTSAGRSIQNRGITPDIEYVAPAGEPKPEIKHEAEQKNTLKNLDSAGTDKTATKESCTAVTPTPPVTVDPALQNRRGKTDFALACAVETLRKKPELTVTTPYVAPVAKPNP